MAILGLFELRLMLVVFLLLPVFGQQQLLQLPQNIAAQCLCPIKHPQEKICQADIVIRGRVIKVTSSEINQYGIGSLLDYTVKATKIYKGHGPSVFRGKRIEMITSSSAGKCGVTQMDIGEMYILTGTEIEGEIFFSVCEWVQRFKELTYDQRRGLKSEYMNGCNSCQIDQQEHNIPGIHDVPTVTSDMCYHDPLGSARLHIEDCESLFSTCIPGSDSNRCAWSQSKRYSKCVEKRRKRNEAKQNGRSRHAARRPY